MKKLLSVIAALMFISVVSVNAQDGVKTETEKAALSAVESITIVTQEKIKKQCGGITASSSNHAGRRHLYGLGG